MLPGPLFLTSILTLNSCFNLKFNLKKGYQIASKEHKRKQKKFPQSLAALGESFGGDNRTRICDLPRVRRTLYRLSYASIWTAQKKVVTRTGIEPVLPP